MKTDDLAALNVALDSHIVSSISLFGNGLSPIRNCLINVKEQLHRERISKELMKEAVEFLESKGAEQVVVGHFDSDTVYFVLNLEKMALSYYHTKILMAAEEKRKKYV